MSAVRVEHLGGDRFDIAVGEHHVLVDQPRDAGGDGTAPTPTDLFVASLAGCVAHYARRYLARHGLPVEGLVVTAEFSTATRPARVDTVTVDIALPDGVPAERRDALLAVASHCTVHNTLTTPPQVDVRLVQPVVAS